MTIHIYTENQIEDIIVKTNHFSNEHLLNYNRAIKRIVCKGKIKKETIDSYRNFENCSFDGYIKFLSAFDSDEDYNELIEVHHNFHKLISEILSNYSTNKPISEKLFNNLYFTHSTLINLLNEIIIKFDFAKNQLDKLTGTWNREIFIKFIEKEYSKMKRGGFPFSLVYFDIDYFKKINDSYSHSTGDYILKELIKLIKHYLRDYDSISRWGGDEFLILLPDTFLNDTVIIIERIKNIINNRTFIYNSEKINITCSFGIFEAKEDKTIEEIIDNADKLLYKAKELGRNRVEV